MPAFRLLRLALIVYWVSAVLGLVLSVTLDSRLPAPLREWTSAESGRDPGALELVFSLMGLLAILVQLVATVGLFNRRRWGAPLFLWTTVVGMLAVLPLGPTVEHELADFFWETLTMATGFILAVVYATPALREDDGLPENVEEAFE
jgi:hypothetical protein